MEILTGQDSRLSFDPYFFYNAAIAQVDREWG